MVWLLYFTDVFLQEANGKYLDMHELYNQYLNYKFGPAIEYSAYLEEFPQTHKIARKHKLSRHVKPTILYGNHTSHAYGYGAIKVLALKCQVRSSFSFENPKP